MIVTLEQVEAAEAEAVKTEAERAEAEKAYSRGAASHSAYNGFEEAHQRHHHIATRARLLRADWERQEAAVRERVEAEEAVVRELGAAARKKLAATRAKAVKSLVEADKVQRAALADVAAYAEALAEFGGELARRGLTGSGQGTTALLGGGVVLEGEVWRQVDGPLALGRLLTSAVAERSPHHPVAHTRMSASAGAAGIEGNEALLAEVRGGSRPVTGRAG